MTNTYNCPVLNQDECELVRTMKTINSELDRRAVNCIDRLVRRIVELEKSRCPDIHRDTPT